MDVDGPTCSVVAMCCGECPDSLSSVGKIVRDSRHVSAESFRSTRLHSGVRVIPCFLRGLLTSWIKQKVSPTLYHVY